MSTPSVCPVRGVCLSPGPCANAAACILQIKPGPDALALDMMYASAPTRFMDFATAQGASARDGLGMLVEQAAEAFALWRGVRPHTAAVLHSLRAGA